MHIGGGLAKLVVRSEEPSGLGHGVSPLTRAPCGTGLSTTGFDWAVGLVFLPRLTRLTTTTTSTPTRTAVTSARRWAARRWVARIASCRARRPSFLRSRLSVGTAAYAS